MKNLIVTLFILLGITSAEARPRGVKAVDTSVFTPSQRTMQNVNFLDNIYDYQFIDHIRVGGSGPGLSPLSGSYASPTYYLTLGNPTWSTDPAGANLDSAGYPQNFTQLNTNSVVWGSHLLLPSSANYGSVIGHGYIIKWTGDCRLTLSPGTWTVQSQTGANYTLNGNGDWSGTNQRIVVTYTGGAQNQQISWRITQSGQFSGAYCRDVHFYREDDEADFLAGKMFRAGYKNILLAQMPSAIRFMNWIGANNSMVSRWENRATSVSALYGGSYWTISPPYSDTAGVGNDFTLAAVTGTPASMVHGEVATARLNHSMVNSNGTGYTVSAIAQCNPGSTCTPGAQVTTSAPHPFIIGDKVVFRTSFSSGMTQINYYNTTITAVADTTHFETSIDTTSFTAFSSGTVVPYVNLQVGSGNDRVSYPVMDTQGAIPIANVGSANFFHANDIRTLYFDKTVFGSRDGSGNLIAGAWMTQTASSGGTNPAVNPVVADVPIEVAATLIKELNELSPTKRIDMYTTMPARALLSMDPDYSGASNYSYNVVNAALAIVPATTHFFFETSPNETWNGPSATFTQYQYLIQRAYLRSGIAGAITPNNYMTALRAVVGRNDIVAALGVNPRVHFVLGGQGASGLAATANLGGVNDMRVYGNSAYYNDPIIQALPKISKTGSTHTNTTLDGLSSTSDLRVGMGITKADVPAGTQINSITNGTTVVMTAAASGTSTSAASFTPTPISNFWGFAWGSYFDPPSNHTAGTFTGTISGTTLTVSGAAGSPTLSIGDFIVGAGVSTNPNTLITALGTGTGGNGTYTVSVSQSVGPIAMTKNQYMGYTVGTSTFTDDSALYNGTNNSGNGGGNYTGVANPTQAIANLNYMLSTATGDSQSVPLYTAFATTYSSRLAPLGVYSMQYEGGYEINPAVNASYGGHTMTAADQAFVLAWQASANWSNTLQAFFTAYRALPLSVMPASLYVMISAQWGYTSATNAVLCGSTSCPDTYFGGVEGGALNQTWTDNGIVNQSLP